jgi:TRAP-type C4-dicarboxylate transport system permease small subunit
VKRRQTELEKIINNIAKVLLAVSAAILTLMMLLTALDVVMRYKFKLPIPGAFELAEYMMAFIVPFAIAYCAEQNGHVSVELFFKKLPKYLQKTLQFTVQLLTMAFAAIMTWQNILYIGETCSDHLASSVLLIPTWPFIIPVAIGMGIYALAILFQLFQSQPEARTK